MAGIFNLFGDLNESGKGSPMMMLQRSKTSIGAPSMAVKAGSLSKPKGLSIRSNSDLNICDNQFAKQSTPNKPQEFLKPKRTSTDCTVYTASPKSKTVLSKKLNLPQGKIKELSQKKSPIKEVFKKPLPLKRPIKRAFPEPETLAPYHDMMEDYSDYMYLEPLHNQLKGAMDTKSKIKPYDDEGFESGPEELSTELPNIRLSPLHLNENYGGGFPSLPEISDDDDI